MKNKIIVPENLGKQRVDFVIAETDLVISRSNLKKRIEKLYVNGEPSKISRKVLSGDVIEYDLTKEESKDIKAEKIELDIIYEDSNVFVINKPAGMVVHPAAGNYSGTMAQGIKYLLEKDETDFSEDDIRPGIVHRLDKDTSGIIIAAKNTAALNFLSAQFRNREASKTYLAIINGVPEQNKGRIETLIGRDKNNRKKMTWKTNTGKEAVTEYKVLSSYGDKSFMALSPKTGRTHQLRVHMLSMKMPIVGDPLYSRQKDDSGLMLHAYKLRIKLPGEDSIREFRVPVADRFKDMLCELSATYLK